MIRFIGHRLLLMVVTLFIVSFGTFLLVKLMPIDPAAAIAGDFATPEQVEAVREDLHLNDPLLSQYWRWLSGAVQGDFGESYQRGSSVSSELELRLPVTLGLIAASTVFALLIGVPLGLLSGLRPNGTTDGVSRVLASLSVAIPNYLLALVLVIVFAVKLKWLPPSGYVKFSSSPTEWLRFMILPSVALGLAIAGSVMRQLRAALIDVLDANYIRTSWAIGGSPGRVVGRHGLKNAASPAITILGLQIAGLVGATVIIEQIFSLPGIGPFLLTGISQADLPTIQACVLVLAVIQILMSLVVDISYSFLNPRVRVAG